MKYIKKLILPPILGALTLLVCIGLANLENLFRNLNLVNNIFDNFFLTLLIFICFGYVLRATDDFGDYDKDLKNNQTIFTKPLLVGEMLLFSIGAIVLSCFTSLLYLIPLFVILVSMLLDKLKYLRAINIPAAIIAFMFANNAISIFLILISVILFALDIIFILKKEKKDAFCN